MNLMDLFIKIGVDDQASGSISQLTSFSIAKGNLMADAIKKGLSVMVDLGKQSINTYADFEQLQGGIKKIFGEDTMNTVLKNADNAYKTAGMSANQYLETTTSFAASLIAGLEGDTEKAAELSDMAIKDMSDNANTFGNDITAIQNAYQGLARQNYSMLDNLRLGYQGTASEMARLINDSGVLGDTVTVTASNLNRVSFDKMIEAIHAIQEEMGITGTTEAEAGGTIAGSLNQTKAAWDNLLVAMVNDPQKADEAWSEFANSFIGSAGKILEAAHKIGTSLMFLLLPEEAEKQLYKLADDAIETLNGALGGFSGLIEDEENKNFNFETDNTAQIGALIGSQMSSNGAAAEMENGQAILGASMASTLYNDAYKDTGNALLAGAMAAAEITNIITINGAQYSDEDELAEVVARKLGQMIDGKGAAYGY